MCLPSREGGRRSCGEAEGASKECCKGLLLGGEGEDNREMDRSVRGVWIDERKHGICEEALRAQAVVPLWLVRLRECFLVSKGSDRLVGCSATWMLPCGTHP